MFAYVKSIQPWLILWLIATATLVISRPVLPVDETRYLSVAWEMWHSHQYLVPTINGLPYSHKPPLLFWLINGSWQLFGVSDLAARLVAPLFGLGSIVLAARLASVLWPDRPVIRDLVPYLLLGMPVWALYASLTMFDTLVTFFALAAWLTIFTWDKRTPLLTWIALGLLIGLGLLAKGPVFLIFTGWPLVLAPWWIPNQPTQWYRWYGGCLFALILGLLLALLWALPAAIEGGTAYGDAILFGQTTSRLVQSFAHQRPVYWYLLLLPLLLFPWSCLPPVWQKKQWLSLQAPERFCLSILGPSLFTLSVVSGKQVHYLMPLLPVFTLLLAKTIQAPALLHPKHYTLPLAGMLILGLALSLLSLTPAMSGDASLLQELPVWIGVIPLLLAAGLSYFLNQSALQPTKVFAVGNVVLITALHLALSQPINHLFRIDKIATGLSAIEQQGRAIAVFPPRLADQFHFAALLKTPLIPLNNQAEALAWIRSNPTEYCLFFVEKKLDERIKQSVQWQKYKNGWLLLARAERMPQFTSETVNQNLAQKP